MVLTESIVNCTVSRYS